MSEKNKQLPAFNRYAAIRGYQPTLAFSPAGDEIAYSTNTSGQFNLWRQPVAGGYPYQITTFEKKTVRSVAWSPDGENILFLADRDGNEFAAPHLIDIHGGESERLTAEPDVQYYLGDDAFSADGQWISYAGNDREPTEQDLLLRNLATGEEKRLLADGSLYFPAFFSPDGRFLSAIDFKGNTNTNVVIVEIATGTVQRLNLGEGDFRRMPGPWLPDGSGIWVLSDVDREYLGAGIYDFATESFSWRITPEWDLEELTGGGSPEQPLVWTVNEDGRSILHARLPDASEELTLPVIPLGVFASVTVSNNGKSIGLLITRPTHPAELFIVDVDTQECRQITQGALGGIPKDSLIEPELIRFTSFDGKKIPAWLYLPSGPGPFPVVLSIHGGPEAQERPTYAYTGLYQYLLSRGVAVLAPNVRGSNGYGISYQKLIHRDWGGDELKDFEAAVQFLQAHPKIDGTRIGVYGGSFGGFATLSCISRLPGYWTAAVDLVGPSNLVTFTRAVPPTWRAMMKEWIGDPETEVDFLMSRSPITYVDQIRTPLFVLQGANDPRVVKAESDQIVQRLRDRGVSVRYDVYEDEGHGFTKRANSIKAMGDIANYLVDHLT